jgi:tRNA (guanine-N7-)-methyltransferase
MLEQGKHRRTIRSYVRREGRITRAQERALKEWWPRFGLVPDDETLAFEKIFGRRAPVILEIGFGNGTSLLESAELNPELNFLGVEVHRPGVGRLLRELAARDMRHIRVVAADAREVLARNIADASLAAVHVFFPDPWPKKRHRKRRLVQPDFAALVARRLERGGLFHSATDQPDYADHMLSVLSAEPLLENAAGVGRYADRPRARPLTKFEQRGRRLGNEVRDLLFRRID